jgi:PST family polysaccharide transporter
VIHATDRLAERTASAATWTALGIVGQRVLSLGSTMVLARLLLPGAYGLLGMAMVLVAAANSFRDLGTSSALVQRKDVSDGLPTSLFWINVLFGLTGAAALAGIAPVAAWLYREPAVAPVLAVLSISFFVSNLSAVHHAILARMLAFRRISLIQLTAGAASTCVGIGLALGGAGVWSLVGGLIAESASATVMFWVAAPWRPTWRLDLADLRQVSSYSLNLVGSRILLYLTRSVDKALVGRYLGAGALGYYSLAHGLMMYPLYNVSWALAQVLFSAFSRIQDDDERLGRAYLRTVAAIATLSFPLMLGMVVTADVLVLACFGAEWLPMVPILMILAPAGMVQSASTTTGLVFTAKGQTIRLLRLVVAEATFSFTAYTVSLRWGIEGIAAAYTIVHLAWSFPLFMSAAGTMRLPVGQVYRALWPPLRDSLLMCAAVLLVRRALLAADVSAPWLVLGAAAGVGAGLYAALVLRSRPAFLREVLEVVPPGQWAWVRKVAALSPP